MTGHVISLQFAAVYIYVCMHIYMKQFFDTENTYCGYNTPISTLQIIKSYLLVDDTCIFFCRKFWLSIHSLTSLTGHQGTHSFMSQLGTWCEALSWCVRPHLATRWMSCLHHTPVVCIPPYNSAEHIDGIATVLVYVTKCSFWDWVKRKNMYIITLFSVNYLRLFVNHDF